MWLYFFLDTTKEHEVIYISGGLYFGSEKIGNQMRVCDGKCNEVRVLCDRSKK